MKLQSINESTTIVNGVFKVDIENGPSNHASRAFGNWQSDNAWDLFAKEGTVVSSYTEGTVRKVKDTGKTSGKVFGTQITVTGKNGYPDIFYTHVTNVKLRVGDSVNIGDFIGKVSQWDGHEKMTHVHIGLPFGKHLSNLIKGNKKSSNSNNVSNITNSSSAIKNIKLSSIKNSESISAGSIGDSVIALQKELISSGLISSVFYSGYFDRLTQLGLIKLQKAAKLSPTGILDSSTLSFLQKP